VGLTHRFAFEIESGRTVREERRRLGRFRRGCTMRSPAHLALIALLQAITEFLKSLTIPLVGQMESVLGNDVDPEGHEEKAEVRSKAIRGAEYSQEP
jgi:hypothetical protein